MQAPAASPLVTRTLWRDGEDRDPRQLVTREWLVANGLGGYASGTISGIATRRYHGLLVASFPGSLGRMMMFNHLVEVAKLGDRTVVRLAGDAATGKTESWSVPQTLSSFTLENGLPVWHYRLGESTLEKRLIMPHGANTVHVLYRFVGGKDPLRLLLQPGLHFRGHESPVEESDFSAYQIHVMGQRVEISTSEGICLRLKLHHKQRALVLDRRHYDVEYPLEAHRGYAHRDRLWSPGHFHVDLAPGERVVLTASTESWEAVEAVGPHEACEAEVRRRGRLVEQAAPEARSDFGAELVLAADQFIVARGPRNADEARSTVAGYHWFTEWGRDTMISLEGLTLATGRHEDARLILGTFGRHIRDGLIPNLFPDGAQAGLYHTADATLWYFHALDRYLAYTGDVDTLRDLLPKFQNIVDHHLVGTHFGIGVDPADGLLRQGAPGYQLTWMDAKVGDWVVTPRRGKAVEINALWYNALRLLEGWYQSQDQNQAAANIAEHAAQARESFNARFWCRERGWLYDVVDGEGPDDASLRPNQLLAISLPHPVLDQGHWSAVLEIARQKLLSPVGLRSLGPAERDYKSRYSGDLRAHDAAYHQGTIWAWLIGPFIDAWLRVHPDQITSARRFLEGFEPHLDEHGTGTISEIFDADPPFTPRGCIAQAWSVAEVLRCWIKTAARTDSTPKNAQS